MMPVAPDTSSSSAPGLAPKRSALAAEVRRELAAAAARGMLLAFDLDGTLAPIVARPEDARIPPEVAMPLRVLAERHPVAIITGRLVATARALLPFEPRYLIGNHGAEGIPGGEAASASFRARTKEWLSQLAARRLERQLPHVTVEDKTYSLSLHYRLEHDHARARDALLAVASELAPAPRVIEGKCVLNLVAPDAPNKGDALAALLAHGSHEQALYAGDDVTDEDVFRASLPGVFTICIAPQGPTAASLVLPRQEDIQELLRVLIGDRVPETPRGA